MENKEDPLKKILQSEEMGPKSNLDKPLQDLPFYELTKDEILEGLLETLQKDDCEKVLFLIASFHPRLIDDLLKSLPTVNWLEMPLPTLQNILIHVDDQTLSRLIWFLKGPLKERLFTNISSHRKENISFELNKYKSSEGASKEKYKGQSKLNYYLAYRFFYEKIKDYL